MPKFRISGARPIDSKYTGWPEDGDPDYEIEVEGDDVRDEYHSMHELYEHRMALTIALTRQIMNHTYTGSTCYRSKKHSDGSMFDGYFIVIITSPQGQISYHYKLSHWDKFDHCFTQDIASEYDGHKSSDVISRLMSLGKA